MKRFLLLALLGLASVAAQATGTTAVVNWLAPTTYDDNKTALPVASLATYNVSWVVKGSTAVVGTKVINAPTLSATVTTGLTCGVYTISVTDTTTATAAISPSTTSVTASIDYDTGITCAPPAMLHPNSPTGLQAK